MNLEDNQIKNMRLNYLKKGKHIRIIFIATISIILSLNFKAKAQEYLSKELYNYSVPDTNFRNQIPLKDGIASFDSIITLNNLIKNEIYIKLKQWGLETFKSEKFVLESEDKEAGFIFYKFSITIELPEPLLTKKNFLNIPNSYTYKIDLTLKFFIKENKYRIQISPITWTLITEKYALRKVNVEGKPNYLEEIGVEALEQYKLDRTNKDHIIDINYYSKLCNLIVTDIQALLEYNIFKMLNNKKSDFEF